MKKALISALALGAMAAVALPSASLASSSRGPAAAQGQPDALPRIEVDGSHLVDAASGETFVPRGANYVKLAPTSGPGGHHHSTFEPGLYDSAAASEALAAMARDGYNVVRVFIDPGVPDAAVAHGIGRGRGTSEPFYEPYVDNVADFVSHAAEHGIYVLPVMDAFPQNDHYFDIIDQNPGNPPAEALGGDNLTYLHPGLVAAKAEYMRQFAGAVEDRVRDLTSTILAYSANNEVYFEGDHAPFDDGSGTAPGLDGDTYDMSNPEQRQQLADTALVEYSQQLKDALESVDGEALLTMGFFTNQAVGRSGFNGIQLAPGATDTRVPGRPSALSQPGGVDFVDMHVYPSSPSYDLTADLASSEHQSIGKPFIIGEMGARKDVYQHDTQRAGAAMRDLQVASCAQGAQGWLFWTYDTSTSLASQDLFYNLVEGGGAINGNLAPVVRADPCRVEPVPPASSTTTSAPPSSTTTTSPGVVTPSSTPTSTSTSVAEEVASRRNAGDLPSTGSNSTLLLAGLGAVLVAAGVGLSCAVRWYRRMRVAD